MGCRGFGVRGLDRAFNNGVTRSGATAGDDLGAAFDQPMGRGMRPLCGVCGHAKNMQVIKSAVKPAHSKNTVR